MQVKMLKMSILMDFKLLLILPFLWACSSNKKMAKVTADVQINIQIQFPHCGGYNPPKGKDVSYESVPNTKFIIFQDSMFSATQFEVETNETGQLTLQLPLGNYVMTYAEKVTSPQQFLERKARTGDFYKSKKSPCFDKWLKTPEFTFSISEDTTLLLTLKYRCFVADNPCIDYIGPNPR